MLLLPILWVALRRVIIVVGLERGRIQSLMGYTRIAKLKVFGDERG